MIEDRRGGRCVDPDARVRVRVGDAILIEDVAPYFDDVVDVVNTDIVRDAIYEQAGDVLIEHFIHGQWAEVARFHAPSEGAP